MDSDIWVQLALVGFLIFLNAIFAGAELALVSLREGQINRLAERGRSGAMLAELAKDPNRFLATIQVVITLSGFFASASAAVSLAGPVAEGLDFLGGAAQPTAVVLVTLAISYVTLVVGELAPKRLAMQKAEAWGLMVAPPLTWLSTITRPAVWLLSKSADLVVRLLGGDPALRGEEVTSEELREMATNPELFDPDHRLIISGAFDFSDRSLKQILRPRRDVVVLDSDLPAEEGLAQLLEAGFSRAPAAPVANPDRIEGVVHLRDLVTGRGTVGELVKDPLVFPETAEALNVLRAMRDERQHLALVVDEHGSVEGIVTIEDLLEELVGEIYDESDRDIAQVVHLPSGGMEVFGSFPVHDLEDLGVFIEAEDSTTVAGVVLEELGYIPDEPGDTVRVGRWEITVLEVADRAIARVRMEPVHDDGPGGEGDSV